MAVDMALGMSFFESGSICFFCTQALGIILEDSVQAVYKSCTKNSPGSNSKLPHRWTRIVGYIWLVVFMSWSTPVWSYPAIRRNQDPVLPFSLFGLLKSRG